MPQQLLFATPWNKQTHHTMLGRGMIHKPTPQATRSFYIYIYMVSSFLLLSENLVFIYANKVRCHPVKLVQNDSKSLILYGT